MGKTLPKIYEIDEVRKLMIENTKCQKHIPPNPVVKNCRLNPYCIQRLGNEKWERLKREQTDNPAPCLNSRDIETQPCGLYNSGNFCYVNSFLQTWYNDLVFRQCIYDWRPDPNFEKPEGTKLDIQEVMNSIQKLFVTMQITPYEHTDAAELINLLKLKNDQQDVQEFFILFFDALLRNLDDIPNGHQISQTILSRVEGKTKKTIACTCGKTKVTEEEFRSISLHINNGAKTLTNLFENHWVPREVMGDYTCDVCGERGNTTMSTECAVVPPVLVVQLNRYNYDPTTGRNKKVATAIQYPRELNENVIRPDADPNSIYELGAVMIHEGPNVTCGHYYDIIKDSKTGNWFSFNDKEVTQAKTPGVTAEKQKNPRATADMKGCYVLIYRKAEPKSTSSESNGETSTPEIRLPPQEIVQEIQRKLNDSFQVKTNGETLSYKIWANCLTERHQMLDHFWTLLEIENGRFINTHPSSIAFLPTELLVDIQKKEFKAVNQLKDLDSMTNGQSSSENPAGDDDKYLNEALEQIGETMEGESDEEYMQRLMEATEVIREEKQAALATASARIKAESNNSITDADMLKMMYISEPLNDVIMELCPHEKISLGIIQTGQIKAVKRSIAEQVLKNYSIGVRLKRSTESGQENGCTDSLQISGLKLGLDLCEECVDLMLRESNFKKEVDECCKMVDAIKKRSSGKGKNGYEYPPSDAFWVSRAQLISYKKHVTNEMKYRRSLGMQRPSKLVFSTKFDGFIESVRTSSRHNSVSSIELNSEIPPEKRRRLNSDKQMDEEEPAAPVANGMSHDSSPEIEVMFEKLNDAQEVYINEDLVCNHGGLNSKAKMFWLHKNEWERLVVGNFQSYKTFPVTHEECIECSDAHSIHESKRMDCHVKLQQISQSIGPLLKRIERRMLNNEGWDHCTHVICSNFLYKFKYALKNKSPKMPTICQECLICSEHELPFQRFCTGVENHNSLRQYDKATSEISGSKSLIESGVPLQGASYDPLVAGPLPITIDEWENILSEFRIACEEDFQLPTEIRIQNGSFEQICNECETKFNQNLLQRRCDYEGAEIFIKLKEDEVDGTKNGNVRAPTTRRVAQKNLIKLRMSSTNTVKELKMQLYRRIKQTPNDQLIYLGETLLEDHRSLGESFVKANNAENPLILITQQHTEISEEPRVIERGFLDTALST